MDCAPNEMPAGGAAHNRSNAVTVVTLRGEVEVVGKKCGPEAMQLLDMVLARA
jgi:hypothetical protein